MHRSGDGAYAPVSGYACLFVFFLFRNKKKNSERDRVTLNFIVAFFLSRVVFARALTIFRHAAIDHFHVPRWIER